MAPPANRPAPAATAGIALWRRNQTTPATTVEVLLVHPGGPFWAGKDDHAWSIPKGEFDPLTEPARDAACREFEEELGTPPPRGALVPIEPFRAGKKILHAFAIEGDFDAASIRPEDDDRSMVELVWPPRSGRTLRVPEVDRALWVTLSDATRMLHKGQAGLVVRLQTILDRSTVEISRESTDSAGERA